MMKRSKPSFTARDMKSGDVRRGNLGCRVPIVPGLKDSPQVTPVPACLQRILSFTGGHLSTFDKSFLKVHLMNSTVCIVRCIDDTRVQDVIDHVIEQLGSGQQCQRNVYGLVAVCVTTKAEHWLHRNMRMTDCHKELHSAHPATDEWRFDLRIRFFFKTILDLLQTDLTAFCYLFDQIKNDLGLHCLFETLERATAIELASLEIRLALRDKVPKTPNRKLNNTTLEESEWKRFLPPCLLHGNDTKLLNKSIQKVLKSYANMSDEECLLKYLDIVSGFWRYFEETFDCQLMDLTPAEAVKVTVGPMLGISYSNSAESSITLASFEQIDSVSLIADDEDGCARQLELVCQNRQSPVFLRCDSVDMAKQLASLIDGYCFLRSSGSRTPWTAMSNNKTVGKSTASKSKSEKPEAPDYAILEEDTSNEKLPPLTTSRMLDSYPSCNCPKASDVISPLSPFASTPDLLSNARSAKNRHDICKQSTSCGSATEKLTTGHPSISLGNVAVSSHSNIVTQLTFEVIEEKLRLQKKQSDDDAEWLLKEEANLILGENNHVVSPKKLNQCDKLSQVSCDSIPEKVEPSDIPVDLLNQVKLDRGSDPLYCATTVLVQSIVDLNGSVQRGHTDEGLVGSAKAVGVQLKALLNVVHSESSSLSPVTREEVEMGQKTLSSVFGHLIDAMRMVIRYSPTDLAQEYRRKMLQLGHTLAVDAKTLFDTVDLARKKMLAEGLTSSSLTSEMPDQLSAISSTAPISNE